MLAPADYSTLDKVMDILLSGDNGAIRSLYLTVEVFHERLERPEDGGRSAKDGGL